MSNEKSQESKAGKSRKKLDLSTAHVADAALPAPKSVYEIVGYPTNPQYKTRDFDTYRKYILGLALWELQDHSQKIGVLPGRDRATTVKRLEDRFLRDNKRFVLPESNSDQMVADTDLRAKAARILSRGV